KAARQLVRNSVNKPAPENKTPVPVFVSFQYGNRHRKRDFHSTESVTTSHGTESVTTSRISGRREGDGAVNLGGQPEDSEPGVEAPPMVRSLPAGPAVPAQMRRRSFPSAAPTLEWHGRGTSGRYDMAMGAMTEHCLPFADDVEVAA